MADDNGKKIYGIDLGTTYSCIAYIKNNEATLIPNSEGDLITPSVVYFENEKNVVVGKVAKQYAERYPDRVASFVKRYMGDPTYHFDVDGKTYRPETISSFILKKLVQDASAYMNEPVTDVVITCPAYFGFAEREATKIAGRLAGLNVHTILNEPTAAAFNFGLDRAEKNQVVMIYDLGGGTFDVTIIQIDVKNKRMKVITTGGDHRLGGKDWDDRIIDYFAEEFIKVHGDDNDPRDDNFTKQTLRNLAEDAKKQLSNTVLFRTMLSYNEKKQEIELSREKFEELTQQFLERTIEFSKKTFEEAKQKGHPTLDQILLVGGSTRMPMVPRALEDAFGIKAIPYEPDQAVAKGAAWVAANYMDALMSGTLDNLNPATNEKGLPGETWDTGRPITPKALGVVVVDNQGKEYVYMMLDKHTHLPAEKTETGFQTVVPNQRRVDVRITEQADGNSAFSPNLEDNNEIGKGVIEDLPPGLPKWSPLHCTFYIKEDGTLDARAWHPESGRDVVINIKIEGMMSEEEIIRTLNEIQGITVQQN